MIDLFERFVMFMFWLDFGKPILTLMIGFNFLCFCVWYRICGAPMEKITLVIDARVCIFAYQSIPFFTDRAIFSQVLFFHVFEFLASKLSFPDLNDNFNIKNNEFPKKVREKIQKFAQNPNGVTIPGIQKIPNLCGR